MQGLAALVVEEEYLIAADIEQTLLAAGAARVEIFRNGEEVRAYNVDLGAFAVAVVEAKLGDPRVIAFCEVLRRAGVAVVVTSADRAVTKLYKGAAPLVKPFDSAGLLMACVIAAAGEPPPELAL